MFSFERNERLVDIGAYCLMPNHFHILIRSRNGEGVSIFMQKMLTAYTMYFNKKYDRNGALFSGPFQVRHVDSDRYLRHLFSYIHANPFGILYPKHNNKRGMDMLRVKAHLKCFPFSSLADYVGSDNREQGLILNKKAFPNYLSTNVQCLEENSGLNHRMTVVEL
jgi:putative transposase